MNRTRERRPGGNGTAQKTAGEHVATSITPGHVLAVKCKTCRARPGQPCRLRRPARNPKWPFHADRLDRALAQHRKAGPWPRGGRRG